jgi:hypothetical protein
MNIPDYLNFLEKNLMTGSARWVTDFSESFREYMIEDRQFDMFLRGSTRTKQGFFLARFFAYTALPDYKVACFVTAQTEGIAKTVGTVERYLAGNDFHWGWLVFLREGGIPASLKNSVEAIVLRNLGVALLDVEKKEIVNNKTYLGKQMAKHLR